MNRSRRPASARDPVREVLRVVDVEQGTWVVDYDRLLTTSPNPNARTVGEDIRGARSPEEAARLEKHLRPLVDAGRGIVRSAFAYLTARKG